MGSSTMNATVLQGGDRHNVIPDRCHYTLDIRYNPSYTAEEIVVIVDDLVEADISVRSSRLAPVETSLESPIVQAMSAAHGSVEYFGSPTLSDWVFLRGIDTIKIGPGDSERSHTPNESVSIDELRRAVPIYEDCVRYYLTHNTHISS